jgi:signal transduction histidine kinase
MWQLSNWRLRTKLLAVVLIPSVAAAIFGGLRVTDELGRMDQLNRTAEEVRLQGPASQLIQQLQRERDLTVAYAASNKTIDPSLMRQQRQQVDGALQKFRGEVAVADAEVGAPYQAVARNLDVLGSLRASVDTTSYPPEDVQRAYSDSVSGLLDLTQQGVSRIHDPELLRLALANSALVSAQEAASLKRAELGAVSHVGSFGPDQVRDLYAVEAKLDSAVRDFRTWATPAQSQLYNDTVTGLQVDNARHLEEYALSLDSAGRPVTINPQDWDAASTETVNLISKVRENISAEMVAEYRQIDAVAYRSVIVASVATIGSLILAFVIALLVARSLLLPLRTLRRSALKVAEYRLPEAVQAILEESTPDLAARSRIEPIPVHTTEEIGRVARSFDAVHSQALRLASEQAFLRNNVNDLFVNLARRSQSLVQRQLSLIDRLEQDEQDPDQLSQLFELDHLATRMRRNNENLLILGGTDLTRRMMRPVPLAEVVGAAVSEVEQYARIVIAEAPELAIQGRVVNDLVHLVAELLENATVFSNPDTEVTVRTAYRRQELVLEIRDRGVGIDAEELGDINERLVRPPEIDVAVSRRMGLYVVGQLSRRHNLRVSLENNSDLEGGVTATVFIASEYVSQLTADGPVPMNDAQPASLGDDQQRDSLVETSTHVGLAAAFGRAGQERDGGTGQASSSSFDHDEESTQFTPQPAWEDEDAPAEQDAEFANQYSVEVASGGPFGATDVPKWDTTGRQDEPDDERTELNEAPWPSDGGQGDREVPPAFDGQCGEPAGVGSSELFNSPFEAEKTTQFEAPAVTGEAAAESEEKTGVFGMPPKDAGRSMDDAPTERLPIYEAVLSQWFRESEDSTEDGAKSAGTSYASAATSSALTADTPISRSTSVEVEVEDEVEPEAFEAVASEPVDPEPVAEEPAPAAQEPPPTASAPGGLPKRTPRGRAASAAGAINGRAEARRAAETDPESTVVHSNGSTRDIDLPQERPDSQERPETREHDMPMAGHSGAAERPEDPGWGSADAGWQAAEALVEQSKHVPETTSAGLPKRVPKTNLVPGSAAPKPQASAPRKPTPPRSADAVRGRMSKFQQGVRRGRHAKAEPVSTEKPRSNSSRHEEQE